VVREACVPLPLPRASPTIPTFNGFLTTWASAKLGCSWLFVSVASDRLSVTSSGATAACSTHDPVSLAARPSIAQQPCVMMRRMNIMSLTIPMLLAAAATYLSPVGAFGAMLCTQA